MVSLKFAAVICLVYFTFFVKAAKKPTCKTVLAKLNEMESRCQGTVRNVFFFAHAANGFRWEAIHVHGFFSWSGAESDTCDVCTVITTLEMKLEAKLENLLALVENISMSLQPQPGKAGLTDLIDSLVHRFLVPFCNKSVRFIWV